MIFTNENFITYLLLFNQAEPTPNFNLNNLTSHGRLDICCRTITATFFLSNNFRNNVNYIAYFKRIETAIIIDGAKVRGINPDERSTAGFIRAIMRGKMIPGVKLVKIKFYALLKQLKNVVVLYEDGIRINSNNMKDILIFPITLVIGDNNGILKPELDLLINYKLISLGDKKYLSSSVITIMNYLFDTYPFQKVP